MRNKAVITILTVLLPLVTAAESLKFREIYSDHMVFQSGMPIRVSGTAAPHEELTGRFSSLPEARTRADNKGCWTLEFPAQRPGGPYSVIVQGKQERVMLSDILIGEVWICAGQSNMEYPVWSRSEFWRSIGGDKAVREADYPQIRFISTPRRTSLQGARPDILKASWQVCSPQTISDFSAVGFYFGRKLHQDIRVPIGLIGCYWSGTRIEPWISEAAYRKSGNKDMQWILDTLRANSGTPLKNWPKGPRFKAWEQRFFAQAVPGKFSGWQMVNFDDRNWKTVSIPSKNPLENRIDGAVLYRKTIELPVGWTGKKIMLSLGTVDDCDETWFNGTKVGATGSDVCSHWETLRNYLIPAELIQTGRNVIAVRIVDFAGDGGFTAAPAKLQLKCDGEVIPLAGEWKQMLEFVSDNARIGKRPDPISNREYDMPTAIFNGMVAPWTELSVRGVIWYQGESNATEPEKYASLFPLLIEDWRTRWKNPCLAFLYAQLSAYTHHTPKKRLPEDAWRKEAPGNGCGFTLLREVQAAALALPYTGMAVTIDIGDQSDIHPQRKQEVGYRLACEAERICYGGTAVSSGPRFSSMTVSGNAAVLSFDNVGSGLTAHGTPGGFVIAGADGRMYHAVAEISGKNRITVRSPNGIKPMAVRYAWTGFPGDANIFNREGFPLGPFHTDTPYISGQNPARIFDKNTP